MDRAASPPACTIACSRCGGAAATVSLVDGGRTLLVEAWRFGGRVTYGDPVLAPRIFGLLEQSDLQAVRRLDPDFAGFWCAVCRAAYCDRCWDIGSPRFADDLPGFYEDTLGWCPEGHQQVVDD